MAKSTPPPAADQAAARPKMNPYLPALPSGWTYTQVVAVGPNDARMSVAVVGDGKASLAINSGDISQTVEHPTVHSACSALGDAAKTLAKIAEREKELALMRTEGLTNLGALGAPKADAAK